MTKVYQKVMKSANIEFIESAITFYFDQVFIKKV